MPITSGFNGASTRAEGFISSFIAKVYDGFARVTSGSLGTATAGQVWVQNNGVWTANNGVAVTASAASSYPFATVPFKSNATLSAQSVSQGAGIVFWQSSASDWWAATTSGTASTYISGYTNNPSSCCTGSNTCQSNSCCTGANTCTYSANCGATYNQPSSYSGTYNSCCYTQNTCQLSYACGQVIGKYDACCTGSNTCVETTTCGQGLLVCVASGNCGTTYFCNNCSPGWSGPCGGTCQRYATATKQVLTYAAGSSYYAGTYNSCCSYSVYPGTYSSCCTGSNNCSASDTCGAVAGTGYQECCTGSYSSCVSRDDCGASSYAGGYYSGAPSTCCTGANNCASSACCTGSNNCTYNAACTTTANYSSSWLWALNIIKSVAGTVSTVATSTLATTYSNTNQINAIKVTTSHTGVSAQGYSDTVLATSIGSPVTATAPSQQDGKGVGIIVTPGGTNQGNSIGPFTAQ